MLNLRRLLLPIALGAALASGVPAAASQTTSQEPAQRPGELIVDTIDHTETELGDSVTVTPEMLADADSWQAPAGRAAATAGLSVTYDPDATPPSDVRAAIARAVARWDSVLDVTAPVEISLSWSTEYDAGGTMAPLPSGVLGLSGPSLFWQVSDEVWVPAGLYNQMTNSDQQPSQPEIVMVLNSGLSHWNTSADDPGRGQIDLESVVLHELAHGLGFLGSATNGKLDPTEHLRYDEHVLHNDQPLLTNGARNSLLTSNDLQIDIGGGNQLDLYAPSSWRQGSSYSHFSDHYDVGGLGSLMTPQLSTGISRRSIDAGAIGVLSQIGWDVKVSTTRPTLISAVRSGTSIQLAWSIDLDGQTVPPSAFRVEAWQGSSRARSATVSGAARSATLTGLSADTFYDVRIIPVGPSGDGPWISTAPGSVSPVTVTGSGLAQTIKWSEPSGGNIDNYQLEVSSGSSWDRLVTTTNRSYTATFAAGTYQFRVRAVNAAGAGEWTYSLPIGVSDSLVRPVPLDGQVARLYKAYFTRDAAADPSGFNYWLLQRAQGVPASQISDAFAGSEEFTTTYGQLNDAQFVDLVYRNVLGRNPDTAGRQYWITQLSKGTTRGQVMLGFSDSPEFVRLTNTAATTSSTEGMVDRLYFAFFLRYPDAGGLDYWAAQLSVAGLAEIADSFIAQQEFTSRYGSLNDQEFVDLVYRNVLAREPDAAGRRFWLDSLATGTSRGAMMIGFSESAEFVIRTGTMGR